MDHTARGAFLKDQIERAKKRLAEMNGEPTIDDKDLILHVLDSVGNLEQQIVNLSDMVVLLQDQLKIHRQFLKV